MRNLPLSKVYQQLEPGPVVMLTTSRKGRANVMAMSWHMMMEFEPPLIGCIVSRANFSQAALSASGECVIAIPTQELARQLVGVGNCSGRDTDKFARFGLTPLPASRVGAPLIGECHVNLECVMSDRTMARRHDMFVLEVVKAWIDPTRKDPRMLHHAGYGRFIVDGETMRLRSRKP